jgi:hypothetical protein
MLCPAVLRLILFSPKFTEFANLRIESFMSQTSMHDRMLAVYRNELPDQIPLGIYIRYLPRGAAERAVRTAGFGLIDYHPVVTMPGPSWHLYPGYMSEIKGASFRIDHHWDDGQLVERRSYQTPLGDVWEEMVEDKAGVGSEHIRKHYIASRDDYRVLTYLVENSVIRSNEQTIRSKMENLGGDGIVLGRVDRNPYQKCLIELVGPERFLVDLHTDPEPALELMEAIDRKLDRSFEMIADSKVEVIWLPDNVTSDMTPPRAYRDYCLRYYQKHTAQCKTVSKPSAVHMDGRIKALKDLVNQTGIDVIESLSLPDVGGNLTLTQARQAFPGMVIIPNFPSNWCLLNDKELESRVSALLAESGTTVPFMLQVSEDIPPSEWKRVLPVLARVIAGDGKGHSRD